MATTLKRPALSSSSNPSEVVNLMTQHKLTTTSSLAFCRCVRDDNSPATLRPLPDLRRLPRSAGGRAPRTAEACGKDEEDKFDWRACTGCRSWKWNDDFEILTPEVNLIKTLRS